jgi:hypothetical protein
MTARRLCMSASRGTEASHEWVVVLPGSARLGESLANTAGLTPKVGSQACPPLKPRVER